jgi:hypothetical protein
MIIRGKPVDSELLRVQKSIADSLKNKNAFQSTNKDTAENSIELHPPIPMQDCLYVFEHSSHVAKSSRILAADVIYNEITLTLNTLDEPDEHEINRVNKINDYLNDNIDELYNFAVDYNYAAWAAMEYVWNNTRFSLKQIPIHTCKIIRIQIKGQDVYLLKQQINSKVKFFKIMGEEYPEDFMFYNGQKLSYASLMGGDNIYQFFGLPRWSQDYNEILTEIAISENDYKTVSNGNISSGVLNINLESQIAQPIQYDENGNPIAMPSREEIISKELQSANSGTAVIFTESNRPVKLDYVSLANSNQSYLSELGDKCQQAVLNDYNIPLIRMMINTDKESMNSDKTKSLWEIYTLNLKNEQKPFKTWIKELIADLYGLDVNVEMTTPIFSDRREIEVNLISKAWDDGALTLRQLIEALSEYLNIINLEDYDFTVNSDIWNYRKIPELEPGLSEDDIATIEAIEAQLGEV